MEHLTTKFIKASIAIAVIVLMPSCYYDVEDELYPQTAACDTLNVTFTNNILPIINSNCTSCHSGAAPSGNIRLEDYNTISEAANNGSLLGVIRHEPGWSPMPKGGGQLNDCNIAQIEAWVNDGTPNN
ncbi:cytochrome c [bacterium]|nr:cytochrome c [bacterium]